MTDIPLSSSLSGIDWCDPVSLASPIDATQDLNTAILLSLATDRVAPVNHYGLSSFDRRGSWQDTVFGELGSRYWFGTDVNLWQPNTSKLAQIIAWTNEALAWLTPNGLTQSDPTVTAYFTTNDSVSISINAVAADGKSRAIIYVLNNV